MATGSIAGFLMEAWEGLVGLEEAVSGLDVSPADTSREAEAPREALVGLAHRLERSAASHGFPRLGDLARSLGRLARHLPPRDHANFPDVRQLLGDTLTVLPMVYENLAAEGREDIPQLAGIQWRYDAEAEAAEELASAQAAADAPGAVDRALDRFRSDDPDALAFFGPEAAEHLDGMASTLDHLRSDDPAIDRRAVLDTLFRHVHTLKGAAFTVGCEPVGHLAHAIEDNLAPARRIDRPLDAATITACAVGLDLLKTMLVRLVGPLDERGSGLQSRYDAVMAELVDRSRDLGSVTGELADHEPTESEDSAALDTSVTEVLAPRHAAATDESTGAFAALRVADADATGELVVPLSVHVHLDRLDRLFDLAAETALVRGRLVDRTGRLRRLGREVTAGRERLVHALEVGVPADRPPGGHGPIVGRARELAADLDELGDELADTLDRLDRDLGRLGGLAARLRTGLGRLRQVTVGGLFERLQRTALQAAEAVGKTVFVDRVGDDIEVDDAVIEHVAEALGHLVRNAVHHGIESETERLDAGKTRHGRLTLTARSIGRQIRLAVADDGRGLDSVALRRRAVDLGLITADDVAAMDERAANELIYLPGLSTADAVTTGAGRGVGMDAVRHAVGRLGGEVRVESATGEGTRFVLDLPASLRVAEVLKLRVGDHVLGLPVAGVRRLVHVFEDRLSAVDGAPTLAVAGATMPLIAVAERLGIDASGPAEPLPGLRGTAVVVAPTGRPAALWVDDVLGIEEVVMRSLGGFLGGIEPFAGVTLDADGRVLLLVDGLSLLEDRGESLAVPPPPWAEPEPTPRARRVLLADDSPSVRQVLGRTLTAAGFDVVTAVDGVEAIERWLAGGVDAVVTDLEMPRSDGRALIDRIRRRSTTGRVPIVVLSTAIDETHSTALDADAWLPKPVTGEVLVDRLDALLAERAGGAA